MIYFPFSEYYSFYLGFVFFVVAMLALDLGVFHKKSEVVSFKEATLWTGVWVSLALIFGVGFYFIAYDRVVALQAVGQSLGVNPDELAKNLTLEYLTGFVIEKALAIDNIFIFTLVFSLFKIPPKYQHRVLFWGIFGALFFRGLFVSIGAVLMTYKWIVIAFGVLLVFTGVKLLFSKESASDLEKSFVMKLFNKFFRFTTEIKGPEFFRKIGGLWHATPLFAALFILEFTDIIFAVDSVPAIFALTKEPLIVFTSNIFAILGLRSMYFMLSGALNKFRYIKYGLSGVLVFVGLKMIYLNELFGGKFPISLSLIIICLMIGTSILFSIFKGSSVGTEQEES